MTANLENSSDQRTGKDQFSIQSQGKAMPKNAETTTQLHSSHLHLPALEKEMAIHSSVLAWRVPRMGETGLPSMESQSQT